MSTPAAQSATWPANGLEAVHTCRVCGDGRRAVLHEGLEDRTFGSPAARWRLVRCTGCGSGYLDPRPTRDAIALAYSAYYTHDEVAPSAGSTGLRAAIANGELNATWGYRAAPALRVGALLGRALPLRAALVGRSVRHLPAQSGGRLLDIGSGSGRFLVQMHRLGWIAEGLEPDRAGSAVARAVGLRVMQGSIEDLDVDSLARTYDAVSMNHVIEHLHDPVGALERVARLLRPGGLLWIATPNLRSLGHRAYGRDWLALDPPRHLVIFHREALEAAVRRAGLVPLSAPRATPDAALTFPASAAIRDGRAASAGPARRAWLTRARAALADRIALRRGDVAEEVVVLARRPARG